MNFLINYENLLKIKNLLLISTNSLENKTENILIICKDKKINFYTNNGFTSCKLIIDNKDVKVIKDGEIFVNSKIFLSLIENLKDYPSIEFSVIDKNLIQITSGKFLCNLVCLEEQNFLMEKFEIDSNYSKIVFSFETLKSINNRFKEFCKTLNTNISKNTILKNINIKKIKDKDLLNVCSTDSYRIIFGIFEFKGEDFNINIPPHTLNNIITVFDEFKNDQLDFYYFENNFIIKTENIVFKSKLFLGEYPNFLSLFDTKPIVIFEIDKKQLLLSLERCLLLSNTPTKTTFFKLDGDKLFIEYKESEKGFSNEELEVENNTKTGIEFFLNSFFLKQLIKNIPSNEIVFSLTDSLKPIIIHGKTNDDNFKQFILPLKSS